MLVSSFVQILSMCNYFPCRLRATRYFYPVQRIHPRHSTSYPSTFSGDLENSNHYLQYSETPEVLFCAVPRNKQLSTSPCSADGLVYPIVSSCPTTGMFPPQPHELFQRRTVFVFYFSFLNHTLHHQKVSTECRCGRTATSTV